MRKIVITSAVTFFVFSFLFFSGCGKAPAAAKEELSLLRLIPENAKGIFSMNVKQALELDIFKGKIDDFKKNITEPDEGKGFESYQDFIDKGGLDIEKDIHCVAFGYFGTKLSDIKSESDIGLLAILKLNYNRDKIRALLKEDGQKHNVVYEEKTYKDTLLLVIKKEANNEGAVAFINDKTIAAGKTEKVRQAIDLSKGDGKSILDSKKMKPFIRMLGKGEMISFAFVIPKELKKVHDILGMLQADLSKAEIVFGFAEYKKGSFSGEFQLVSHNGQANAQLVSILNNTLAVAGMASPDAGELVKNINFSSSADNIRLTFSISEELLNRLPGMIVGEKPGLAPPPEE